MFNWLFEWFQRRCPHDPSHVRADILEGDGRCEVKWCLRCGAYRFRYPNSQTDWRGPRATWAE